MPHDMVLVFDKTQTILHCEDDCCANLHIAIDFCSLFAHGAAIHRKPHSEEATLTTLVLSTCRRVQRLPAKVSVLGRQWANAFSAAGSNERKASTMAVSLDLCALPAGTLCDCFEQFWTAARAAARTNAQILGSHWQQLPIEQIFPMERRPITQYDPILTYSNSLPRSHNVGQEAMPRSERWLEAGTAMTSTATMREPTVSFQGTWHTRQNMLT